jgi:HEAT repeat protein
VTDDASPENLRKFLESDDPALVLLGLSMAKGSGVPEELLGLVAGLYMWHDDKVVRAAAKSTFTKYAPDELKDILKGTWNTSYRTMKTRKSLYPKVDAMLKRFNDTPFDSMDVWVPALSRSAGDKVAIVSVLGTFGEPAVEPLIKALEDDDEEVRETAARALGQVGDSRAVKPLIKALGDGDWEVRKAAAKALGKIGKPAVEPLIKALGDDGYGVAEAAAEALGEIGDTRAVEPLSEALGDDGYGVAEAAAIALGKIGKPAVKPLIKALGDGGRDVRWHAAVALREIGDARAVEPLIKVLGDGDLEVRQYAKEALKKLGHEVE